MAVGAVAAVAAPAAADDKPHRTNISDQPWAPTTLPAGPKVVYGTDDRIDIYEETNSDHLTWAASTCGLFNNSSLTQNSNGTFTIRTSSYNVCADEPFANQPTAAFCSGFIVGDDLIATAGHCFDSGDLNNVRFVFGFVMEDANTPVLVVQENQVYTGVQLIGRALQGGLDYAVVRVDRPITTPGAEPFSIRREGTIAAGAAVGVIGHPSGLPLKIAFGSSTVVRDSSNPGFFVANLDTFGGNSGSPVINQATGALEGILVRGEQDFIRDGGCQRSNVVSNTGGRGEDVSKSTSFMQFIPELISSNGDLRLDREAFRCDDTITINLTDSDMAGMGAVMVDVTATGNDMETLTLMEIGGTGEFEGTITISGASVVVGNGTLEALEGETVSVFYMDLQHGPESPDEVLATAIIDCTAPVVSNVEVINIGARVATVRFNTDETVSGRVVTGTTCGTSVTLSTFVDNTDHHVLVQGLLPLNPYFFSIEVADEAGNMTVANNAGTCFSFATAESTQYYTEAFTDTVPDLENSAVLFEPNGAGGYDICRESIAELPVSTAGSTTLFLTDDSSQRVQLESAAVFPFFGIDYAQFYVNANGNITFSASDGAYDPFTSVHFSVPRIAPCFTDLNPSAGGIVSYRQLGDRVVVTWLEVPHYRGGEVNTIQLEMFFDGAIRFSYRNLDVLPALVGLSAGTGVASDFSSTDLSTQEMCGSATPRFHTADTDEDFIISLQELLRVVQFLNLDGFHCDPDGEDGYSPGPGDQSCTPHDSDYNTRDWDISLSELLRLVQLFNAVGYEYNTDAGTEDNFVPIPNP